MAAAIKKDKLEIALNDILEVLEEQFEKSGKKNIFSEMSENDRHELIDAIFENLTKDGHELFSAESLQKKPQVRDNLLLTVLIQLYKKENPSFKFDYAKLFDKELIKDNKLTKKELKNLIKEFLMELHKLNPNEEIGPGKKVTPEYIDKLAENIADDLTKKLEHDQENLAENDSVFKTFFSLLATKMEYGKDPLSETLLNLLGIDKLGSTPKPVRRAAGNLMGIADVNGYDGTSGAFIDAQNRFDAYPDPHGIEAKILDRLKAIGGTDGLLNHQIDDRFQHDGVYPSGLQFKPPSIG